jgi:hypothetical protein
MSFDDLRTDVQTQTNTTSFGRARAPPKWAKDFSDAIRWNWVAIVPDFQYEGAIATGRSESNRALP